MKKRAAAKKPAARTSAAKKTTKVTKAPKAATKAARPEPRVEPGKYTPTPIQGIGWAPFRYPL